MSAATVSFFPEKPSKDQTGEKPKLLSASGQTELIPSILDGTCQEINATNHPPEQTENHFWPGYFGDTFENTGNHFSDLAANDFGFSAPAEFEME